MPNIPRTVLHVDDDLDLLRVVSRKLTSSGYEVFSLADPIEALQTIHRKNIRLVLLDIDLPRMNGLDVLRQIKKEDGGVQVILLTGVESISTVLQAMRWGAEACVFKPLTDFESLLCEIESAFHKIERWWKMLAEIRELRKLELVGT